MADRNVSIRVRADVAAFVRDMDRAAQAAESLGRKTEKAGEQSRKGLAGFGDSVRKNSAEFTQAGATVTAFGAATTLALGGSAKAAIDWESAFAGVRKTVNASAPELAELEAGLRGMARELPASQTEIAGVAEAAGQLGIQTPNILDFTRTMVDLGETTNLSAQEAATSLARFANVMGTSQGDFDRLGSSIVALGNNYATTEREIVEMATRLAGAGRQAGLAESDVLGLATALSSVGIEAEAGGTAFSRVLIDMGNAVDTQSESLETFARVAGMSAAQFSQAWATDPGSAVQSFIAGLGGMEAAGESIQPVLSELGLTDIRVGDALRRSAGAADLLTGALDTSKTAFAENTALADEAAQRYETTAAQLQVLKNNLTDAAISLGSAFLPAIAGVSEVAASAAEGIARMPEPLQRIAAYGGGAAGAASLLAGGFLLLAPRALETYDAFKRISAEAPRLSRALGGITKVGAAAGALVTVAVGLEAISDASDKAAPGVEEITAALLNIESGGAQNSLDQLIAQMEIIGNGSIVRAAPVDSLADAIKRLDDPGPLQKIEQLDKAFDLSTSADQAAEAIAAVDSALAHMSTSSEGAERAASLLDGALEGTGYSAQQIMEYLPQYRDALAGLENDQQLAADGADAMGAGMSDASAEVDAAAAAADEAAAAHDALATALSEVGSVLLGARGSARGYAAAVDEASAAAAENGASLDISTEAGRANQAALDGVASATMAYAEAAFQAGAGSQEVASIVRQGRADFIAQAEAMGMSRAEAQGLADSLGLIPENVVMQFEQSGIEGIVQDVNGVVDYSRSVEALIQMGTDPAVAEQIVDDFIFRTSEREAVPGIDADATEGNAAADAWYDYAQSQRPQPNIDANRQPADMQARLWEQYARSLNPTAKMGADNSRARTAAAIWDGYVRGLAPSARVYADASSAYGTVSAWTAWARTQRVTVGVGSSIMQATGGPVIARASGGRVTGPGGPTDDMVPAFAGAQAYRLSDGEWITRASSVSHYGTSLMAAINEQRIDKNALLGAVRRADGGMVGSYEVMQPHFTVTPSYSPAPAQPVPAPEPIDYGRLAAAMAGVQVHATASLDPRQVDQRISRFNSETSRGVRRP